MASKFSPDEKAALEQFEVNRDDWDRGCIGTTRKVNNARALVASYLELTSFGIADALIEAEKSSVRSAASYLELRMEVK